MPLKPSYFALHVEFSSSISNREVRRRKRDTSLMKTAPTVAEIQMLHSLLKKSKKQPPGSASGCCIESLLWTDLDFFGL